MRTSAAVYLSLVSLVAAYPEMGKFLAERDAARATDLARRTGTIVPFPKVSIIVE